MKSCPETPNLVKFGHEKAGILHEDLNRVILLPAT